MTGSTPASTSLDLEAKAEQSGVMRRVVPCTNTVPERHERGEFPMTYYPCHVWADS